MSERIPRKPGQPAKSDKHSDLYTDEDPKGTIHGLKFATPEDAKASVSKIKSSGRSHAHKIQAAVAMEQRAKEMGKASSAAVYRSFINSMKDKTKEMQEDWSNKYKKSIDCDNPKGFSQKAHCQARKLRQSGKETKSQPVNETMKKEMGSDFIYLSADETALKTMIRSNPGIMKIENGTVKNMWHWRQFEGQE
jgi:hypothetical protein